MKEERYHGTTQNRFYPDMSKVNKNIIVEAELISPPMHISYEGWNFNSGNYLFTTDTK